MKINFRAIAVAALEPFRTVYPDRTHDDSQGALRSSDLVCVDSPAPAREREHIEPPPTGTKRLPRVSQESPKNRVQLALSSI